MQPSEKSRFDALYPQHLRALTLQGKADATIDSYSRAVRRLAEFVDRCPDTLTAEDLKAYFAHLTETRSWSLLKIGRDLVAYDPERATVTFRYHDGNTDKTPIAACRSPISCGASCCTSCPKVSDACANMGFFIPRQKSDSASCNCCCTSPSASGKLQKADRVPSALPDSDAARRGELPQAPGRVRSLCGFAWKTDEAAGPTPRCRPLRCAVGGSTQSMKHADFNRPQWPRAGTA